MENRNLFAVLLAAGSSRRFGSTKQLAEIDGVSLAARAARLCESVCEERSVLVLGNDWARVHDACEPLLGFIAINPDFETGIATSIRRGVNAIRENADGMLLMLADQPRVSDTHLKALEARWRESPQSIVASAYADTLGPPIIFPKQDFPALSELHGDTGAKAILLDNPDRLQTIECEAAAIDIDVQEDLQRL
ncbi:MAG: nucleotidyltransferase family protein [Woeseia sp.]|jgi:molybdenum cofactor cytidylyltransferase|nr:nucleotidyltransferase family protein [Woeseia sp.]